MTHTCSPCQGSGGWVPSDACLGRFTHFIEVDGGRQTCVWDVAMGSGRVALTRVHDGGVRRGIEEPRSCDDARVSYIDGGDGTH